MSDETPSVWQRRFGGHEWTIRPDGVHLRQGGPFRTAGAPVTMRRVRQCWGGDLASISDYTGVPLEILMMTVVTEGALRWDETRGSFTYPVLRQEPGFRSDNSTPHRVSFGPMHVLLSTYRIVMRSPGATRDQAMDLRNNLVAGALFIANTDHLHRYDPILVAAVYNSGGIYDASDPASRYHNAWHLRAYDHDGPAGPALDHLTRAARWYGDARAVLAEKSAEG